MTSLPLDSTHGRTTWGMAGHHRPWTVHTVGNVGRDMPSLPLDTRSNDVGLYMSSPPLESTHGRTTSGMECHHCLLQHTRSNDVLRGMTSPPLDCTHGRTMSDMACHHRLWTAQTVTQRRAWHDITFLGQHTRSAMSGVESHHRPWLAHTVGRRRP